MKLLALKIFFIYYMINISKCEKYLFDGYRLINITPLNNDHLEKLNQLQHNPDFDLWDHIVNKNESLKVLLSPRAFSKYSKYFKSSAIPFEIIHDNFQQKINEQEESMRLRKRDEKSIKGKFARYSEIINFINEVVATNPDIASSYTAGKTYENRELKTLVINTGNTQRSIWIDCGFHAVSLSKDFNKLKKFFKNFENFKREWISPSTCVWIINRLIEDYRANDALVVKLLAKYELHILTLVNPDGYEYTFNTFRMWRKNRNPNPNSSCVGTDLNRNFGFQWMTGGSSSNPCSETYAGPSADSELETKGIISAILKKRDQWDAYLTYGQYWLTSWSYTTDFPSDFDDIFAKAKIGSEAITTYNGTKYTVGHSGQLFGKLSGVSDDWAKGFANIKYAYTLELSPGDNTPDGSYGFALPETRAPRVGEETYRGIKAFINSIY